MNLAENPSGEVSIDGFGNFIGGSIARAAGSAYAGGWAVEKTPSGDAHGINVTVDSADWTPGETYTGSAWVKGEPGELVLLRLATGSGQFTTSPPVAFTGEWQRIAVTRTTDEEPLDDLVLVVFGGSAAETPSPWLVDAVQVEPGSVATRYLDGSLGDGYAWDGDPHASTSTRAASDLSAAGHGLAAARGGVAVWVTPDWAAGDGQQHVVLHRRASADEGILLAHTEAGAWRLEHTTGGQADAVEVPATHGAGETVFLTAGWTERRLELRVGQTSAVASRSRRPPLLLPTTRVQLGRRHDADAGHLDGELGQMAWYAEPLSARDAEVLRRAGGLHSTLRMRPTPHP